MQRPPSVPARPGEINYSSAHATAAKCYCLSWGEKLLLSTCNGRQVSLPELEDKLLLNTCNGRQVSLPELEDKLLLSTWNDRQVSLPELGGKVIAQHMQRPPSVTARAEG